MRDLFSPAHGLSAGASGDRGRVRRPGGQRDTGTRLPKIAVPTRTSVAPSSIGHLEVVAHPHRQLAQHRRVDAARQQPVADAAQRAEIRPRPLPDRRPPAAAASGRRRAHARGRSRGVEDRRAARPRARRAWSPRRRDRPAPAARSSRPAAAAASSSFRDQRRRCRPSGRRRTRAGLLRLVRLQVADQVPAERRGRRVWSIFCSASWTLFSPKSTWPASAAARTWSAGKVLETATRRMEAGSRPARPAARAMRARTSASRARSATAVDHGTSSAAPSDPLRRGGVRPVGASFR